MRFAILKFAAVLILLFTSSCVTKSLWSDPSYREQIFQFLSDSEGRYVVLVGNRYHYVLVDNSGLLKTYLTLQQKNVLTINTKKTHLKVEGDNSINGDLVIDGSFGLLPPEDKAILINRNIRPNRYDELTLKMKITGRRYTSKYLGTGLAPSEAIKQIEIFYSNSNAAKVIGKAAITPIAVTLDAVLLIGKVVLTPLTTN